MTPRLTQSRDLYGRVAPITGASRGVGATGARAFAAGGAKVGLLSRSGQPGFTRSLDHELREHGVRATAHAHRSYRPMNEASWG